MAVIQVCQGESEAGGTALKTSSHERLSLSLDLQTTSNHQAQPEPQP